MKYSRLIPYAVILVLIVYIFALRECNRPSSGTIHDTITVTRVDTLHINHYYPRPEPYETIDCVWVWQSVDTAQILAECNQMVSNYNRLKIYHRTFQLDTVGTATITDSVFRNQLLGYSIAAQIKAYTTTHTIYIDNAPKKKPSLLVGAHLGSNGQRLDVVPSIMLRTKKDHYYNVGYDPFNKTYYVGMLWKIF